MSQKQPENVTGDGGNKEIVNQDEQKILDKTTMNLRIRTDGPQDKPVERA